MKMKVILASGSPRRKELLTWAGVPFEIRISEIDETPRRKESPLAMVKRLSLEKALVVATTQVRPDERVVIIAADTTVVSPVGKILGKPVNESEAMKMINAIQGKTHRVLTGFCLVQVSGGKVLKKVSKVVKTSVTMRKLNRQEQQDYVSRGESMDKAGAYAAQGFGMVLIEKISGSYTNVVGLPMKEVLEELKKLTSSRFR
jgi:septum formation protein